jgi:hypothetical protein
MQSLTTALSQVFWISLGALAVGHAGAALIRRFVK